MNETSFETELKDAIETCFKEIQRETATLRRNAEIENLITAINHSFEHLFDVIN